MITYVTQWEYYAGHVRYHLSGLIIIDQEDENETNERSNTSRNNQVEYESYGSDDKSEMLTESSAKAIKKLTRKSS